MNNMEKITYLSSYIINKIRATCVIPAKSWIPYNSEDAVLLGGCGKCRTGSEDAQIAKMVTPTCTRRMPYSSEDAETAVPARRMHCAIVNKKSVKIQNSGAASCCSLILKLWHFLENIMTLTRFSNTFLNPSKLLLENTFRLV